MDESFPSRNQAQRRFPRLRTFMRWTSQLRGNTFSDANTDKRRERTGAPLSRICKISLTKYLWSLAFSNLTWYQSCVDRPGCENKLTRKLGDPLGQYYAEWEGRFFCRLTVQASCSIFFPIGPSHQLVLIPEMWFNTFNTLTHFVVQILFFVLLFCPLLVVAPRIFSRYCKSSCYSSST